MSMKARSYTSAEVSDMEITLCKLHSLGELLALVCTTESTEPAMDTLADLGRVITDIADQALNMLQDGHVMGPLTRAAGF